jgi:transcriptional regulator with XRE-family HTH domain
MDELFDAKIAARLKSLRADRGWPLDELARASGVSRATLSRLENGEVSPTANVLGKLCSAFGLTMSRLMMLVEDDFEPLIRRASQTVWQDAEIAFRRRSISPPAKTLGGEVIACDLGPRTTITYDKPSKPGLEHHLLLIEGALSLTIDGTSYELGAGDCLRYLLHGRTTFATSAETGAHYLLFMV